MLLAVCADDRRDVLLGKTERFPRGDGDLVYERQFSGGDSAVLEFTAHVGVEPFKAVHLLRFNDAGEIIDIDLIARPAKGVIALGNGVAAKAAPQIKAALAAAAT